MDDQPAPNAPTDTSTDESPPNTNSLAVVRGGAPAPLAFDAKPIYRVLEVFRDGNGRLRKEGRVWHTDLNRMRKFGRAVASNTSSVKVLITDAVGDVMEELSPPPAEERQSRWGSWEDIPLPPCPPKIRKRATRKPALPAPVRPVTPFPALNIGALQTALDGASPGPVDTSRATAASTPSPFDTLPPTNTAAAGADDAKAADGSLPTSDSPLVGDFGSEGAL